MTRHRVGLLTLAALTLATSLALAEEPPDAGDGPRTWLAQRGTSAALTTPAAAPSGSSVRVGAGVLLVAVAALAAWLFNKKRPRGSTSPSGPRVEVLSSARIGPKAQAVVARVGSRVVLLGVTDGSVQRLAWLSRKDFGAPEPRAAAAPEPGAAAAPAPAPEPGAPVTRSPGFGEVLRDALGLSAPRLNDPALVLAASTRDVYTPARTEARAPRAEPADSVDVESQARGLVARLKELGP